MNFILLRGLVRETGHWGEFITLLQNAPWCDQVLPLDLLGAGEHHQKDAPLHVQEYTDYLQQNHPLTGKWVLLGISFGGMIALDWCHRYPDAFSKLILINSSAGNLSPFWQRMRPGMFLHLLRLFLWHDNPLKREEIIFSMASNLKKTDNEIIKQMASVQEIRPASRKNCLRQAMAGGTFRLPLIDSLPTIIFASEKDRLVHPLCSVKMAETLKAPIVWHPSSGHDLPLDDPNWLVEEMGKFVNPENLTSEYKD